CTNEKTKSCDGVKGCVKIWLEALGNMLERGGNAEKDLKKAIEAKGKDEHKQWLTGCYQPSHSAMIRCDTGKCAYIYGLEKPEVNVVANFDKVVMPNGQKYPGDKAEYWKCPCP